MFLLALNFNFASPTRLRRLSLALILSVALLPAGQVFAQTPSLENDNRPHVILISVDGLGAELLKQVSMPRLKKIAALGESAMTARTIRPVATIPAHVSMISSVSPEVHKSTWNENDDRLVPAEVPNLFDLLKTNGKTSIFITGKEKLKKVFETHPPTETVLPRAFPFGATYGRIPSVVDSEVKLALEEKPDLLFIHYALADTIGHAVGWGSWLQRIGLNAIDKSIERTYNAAVQTYGKDGFVFIVTADHGGHEASHGRTRADGSLEDELHDLFIPWIVVGAKLQNVETPVSVLDVPPTVACVLGLQAPDEWKWEGVNRLESSCPKQN